MAAQHERQIHRHRNCRRLAQDRPLSHPQLQHALAVFGQEQRTTPTAMTRHAKSAMILPMRVLRSKRAYVRKIMMTAAQGISNQTLD